MANYKIEFEFKADKVFEAKDFLKEIAEAYNKSKSKITSVSYKLEIIDDKNILESWGY